MKVGLLHPRSGISSLWAASMDASALLGAAEINAAGGVLGREIELIHGDCGFSAAEAHAAVSTLLDLEGADVIIGGHPSNLRDTVTTCIGGKVPFIYTPHHEGGTCGPSSTTIGSTDREILGPALQWLRDQKQAERFYFVGNDYNWPRAAFAALQQVLRHQGGQLVGHDFMANRAEVDDALLKRIGRSGAQVVVQALVGHCAVAFNRAFATAGLDEKMLRFGLIIDETVVCAIGADATTNLFTGAHYFAGHHSRSNDRFLERYHDAFGDFAPPASASSVVYYEGLHLMAELAGQLGTCHGAELARHIERPLSRPAARTMLGNKPIGRSPGVHLGRADGVRLEVVASF